MEAQHPKTGSPENSGGESQQQKEESEKSTQFVSPRARRAVQLEGLNSADLQQIAGTGPNGRVIEKDVLAFAERIKVTPLARKVSAENGVNLTAVTGSGLGGKIMRQDVLDHMNQDSAGVKSTPMPAAINPNSSSKTIPLAGLYLYSPGSCRGRIDGRTAKRSRYRLSCSQISPQCQWQGHGDGEDRWAN